MPLPPSLHTPPSLGALGIVAARKTDEWIFRKPAKGGRWESVLLICDNAMVSKRASHHLAVETNQMGRLLFAVAPRRPRYLSNATRWSLGGGFRHRTYFGILPLVVVLRRILWAFPISHMNLVNKITSCV